MTAPTAPATAPVGYPLAKVLDATTDPVVRRSRFGMLMLRLYAQTFVASAGRQYAQLCDMIALVALLQDRARAGRLRIDWELVLSPRMVHTVAGWPLPGGHTGAPERTPGQVAGVYRFWWLAFCDAWRWRYLRFPLPGDAVLDERMEACGVPIGMTSSSTWEEMAAIRAAWAAFRTAPQLVTAPAEALAWYSLPEALAAALHWQVHGRPRSRVGGEPRPDRHALWLRDGILAAAATPPAERDPYDDLLLLRAAAIERLLDTPAESPRLRMAHRLHRRLIHTHNVNHPDTPIAAVHA
jgi:hypothetical protein